VHAGGDDRSPLAGLSGIVNTCSVSLPGVYTRMERLRLPSTTHHRMVILLSLFISAGKKTLITNVQINNSSREILGTFIWLKVPQQILQFILSDFNILLQNFPCKVCLHQLCKFL